MTILVNTMKMRTLDFPLRTIDLGFGVTLTGRPIDAFKRMEVLADTAHDIEALLAGDATRHPWSFTEEQRAVLQGADRRGIFVDLISGAMSDVLLGLSFISAPGGGVGGVESDDGSPCGGFEACEFLLFQINATQKAFRAKSDVLMFTHKEIAPPPASDPSPAADAATLAA